LPYEKRARRTLFELDGVKREVDKTEFGVDCSEPLRSLRGEERREK
jgi:hypothetical protein